MMDHIDLYYILDRSTPVGDYALWWKPNGRGYTTNLDEAGLYPLEFASNQRPTDIPVPEVTAVQLSERAVKFDAVLTAIKKGPTHGR